jgi:hypothetical protein
MIGEKKNERSEIVERITTTFYGCSLDNDDEVNCGETRLLNDVYVSGRSTFE